MLVDRVRKLGHALSLGSDDSEDGEGLRLAYPYRTPPDEPLRFETKGNYADPSSDYQGIEYGWNHTMGDIVNGLIKAGLTIDFLHEHHFSVDRNIFKALVPEPGTRYYVLKNPIEREAVPLMFSIKAHKAGA